ncbi:hypothetical protein AB0O64_25105 [Streptomyces sp. NPDC088341]|uniref:SCO2400 family protein n=1 Tax=Streptomyces sp. NPDC088341 TaxID=3154870 RepID=UPI00343936F4
MDYCDQCRRHLNGALACAGCGTPAEELRQQAPPSPGPQHSRRPDRESGGTEDHGEYEDAPDGELVLDELVLTGRHPEPGPGRRDSSSRRRKGQSRPRGRTKPRRARGRRRRKVLIATFGVLLSLATLSLAELAMESPGKDDATAVKEETPVDFEGGPRDTERPEAPDDPGPAPSADPGTTGSARPGGSGEPGTPASGETAVSPSAPADDPGEDGPDPSESGSPGPDGSTPGTTGPSGPTGEPTSGSPTTQAPPPPPPPAPEPTETCILWIFCS